MRLHPYNALPAAPSSLSLSDFSTFSTWARFPESNLDVNSKPEQRISIGSMSSLDYMWYLNSIRIEVSSRFSLITLACNKQVQKTTCCTVEKVSFQTLIWKLQYTYIAKTFLKTSTFHSWIFHSENRMNFRDYTNLSGFGAGMIHLKTKHFWNLLQRPDSSHNLTTCKQVGYDFFNHEKWRNWSMNFN